MPDVHGTCRTATKRAEALKDLLRVQAGLLRQCRTLLCRSSPCTEGERLLWVYHRSVPCPDLCRGSAVGIEVDRDVEA